MNITFLVPPSFNHPQPAERSAGCTRVVYPAPNIYELTVAAVVQQIPGNIVKYKDFVNDKSSREDFINYISKDDSDVYFIWSVNLSIETDLEAIDLITTQRKNDDIKIILLGPAGTYFTNKLLVNSNIVIVRGEPEETVRELIEKISAKEDYKDVKGISYLDGTTVRNNPSRPLIQDINSLPFPARELIENIQFHNPKLKVTPYTTMVTSRNCPYKCIYCVPSSLTFAREIEYRRDFNRKPPISFRSAENVENEIKHLVSKGYKAIGFMDDNFIWNEERTRQLTEILKRYGIVWGCQARVDAITEPIARMLSESNCRYVDLGIESFNDEILKYIKKGISSKDIVSAIKLLQKYNVPVKLNVLIGSSPLETKETIRHTLKEAKKLNVDQVMFNIVSPFPGTEYHEICKKNGWIKGGDYHPTDVQRESILELPNLSSKEMERLLFKNNLSYFLSPRFIVKQLKRYKSIPELKHSAKALKIKLFG